MGDPTENIQADAEKRVRAHIEKMVREGKHKVGGSANAMLALHRAGHQLDYLDFATKYEMVSATIVSARSSIETGVFLVSSGRKELAGAMEELNALLQELEAVAENPLATLSTPNQDTTNES